MKGQQQETWMKKCFNCLYRSLFVIQKPQNGVLGIASLKLNGFLNTYVMSSKQCKMQE